MNKPRLRQFLALFLVLCMLCSTTLPIYAEVPTGEVTPVETSVSVSTPENAASDAGTEKSSDDASSLSSATPETALSEAAQARKPRMRRRLPSMPRKISIWLFPMRSARSTPSRPLTVL